MRKWTSTSEIEERLQLIVSYQRVLFKKQRRQIQRLEDQLQQTSASAKSIDTPQDFLCPITLEIMQDPVMLESGHSFERAAIVDYYLKTKKVDDTYECPLTRKILTADPATLPRNQALFGAIHTHLEQGRTLEVNDVSEAPNINLPKI